MTLPEKTGMTLCAGMICYGCFAFIPTKSTIPVSHGIWNSAMEI
jgi:hypothetical protein